MDRVGEEFPLECPRCGGDIRLIAFMTEPGPIRKILTHLGKPLEPPPVSPARGPPTDRGELVQVHDDREAVQVSPDELPAIDIRSLSVLPGARHQRSRQWPDSESLCADARKTPLLGGGQPSGKPPVRDQKAGHAVHDPRIRSRVAVEVPLAGLSLRDRPCGDNCPPRRHHASPSTGNHGATPGTSTQVPASSSRFNGLGTHSLQGRTRWRAPASDRPSLGTRCKRARMPGSPQRPLRWNCFTYLADQFRIKVEINSLKLRTISHIQRN